MKKWANDTLPKFYAKAICPKCKTLITFYKPYSCICKNCKTKVYPTKEIEFKEKYEKERRKYELRNVERECN